MPTTTKPQPQNTRPNLKLDRELRAAFVAIVKRRHRTQSELIYRWLLDAYQVSQHGGWLPPKPPPEPARIHSRERGEPTMMTVQWSQERTEYRVISDALDAAGSSVRAVVEHAIRWYVDRDGDLLSAPEGPFSRSKGRRK